VLTTHAHVRFPGIDAETMLVVLDRLGVSASSGAACSSGSIEPSHVLLAAGFSPDESRQGLRFSFGRSSDEAIAVAAADRVVEAVHQIRTAGRNR
jgi:cysteine desulfurase